MAKAKARKRNVQTAREAREAREARKQYLRDAQMTINILSIARGMLERDNPVAVYAELTRWIERKAAELRA